MSDVKDPEESVVEEEEKQEEGGEKQREGGEEQKEPTSKEVMEAEIVGIEIPWLKHAKKQEGENPEPKEESGPEEGSIVLASQSPTTVFALPLEEINLFPGMVMPVNLPGDFVAELMAQGEQQVHFVGFFGLKGEARPEHPKAGDLYEVGVVAQLLRVLQMPNGMASAVLQVKQRCQALRFVRTEPYLIVRIALLEEKVEPSLSPTHEALARNIRGLLADVAQFFPRLPPEFLEHLSQLEDPSALADLVALQFAQKSDRQAFLEELDLRKRLEKALAVLLKESEMLKLQHQLREEIESQVEGRQREYLLREQLKLIRKELGEEADEKDLEMEKYQERIAKAAMPPEVEKRAKEELRRLSVLPPEAGEYNIIRTYLDWICDLPWSARSEGKVNLRQARQILNRDHFGLERVKERILEFLAVHKLKPDQKGAILCLSGPPGVGKTSLGRSIAAAMGREFYRFSVGGMRDEAEIKGHRRTYIGAMPGKLLLAMKRAGVRNPVLMLDEIDKIGKDNRGDPASALLEVLDPAQNHSFVDHYLDLPFDLSEVMFIATANYRDAIPPPLLDRMEVINLSGYIPQEKVEIARRYLLPRQREAHGLKAEQLKISKNALHRVVDEYTRESGVRNLEREIGAVCRKVATRVAEAKEPSSVRAMVGEKNVEKYLGAPRFLRDKAAQTPRVGRVFGLAWTPVGGDLLAVEVTRFPGNGRLELTGKLGDVMTESSRIALSYLKAHAERFRIDLEALPSCDLHLHVPAGAVPKDGPSAGITITTAFLSLLSDRAPEPSLAMTGEVTLMGEVLPVGGIREKVVAAAASGMEVLVLPELNRKDLDEVPDYILEPLEIHFAGHYEDVIPVAFGPEFLK